MLVDFSLHVMAPIVEDQDASFDVGQSRDGVKSETDEEEDYEAKSKRQCWMTPIPRTPLER